MNQHDSALSALDEFFRVIRAQAESDSGFAAELVGALGIPLNIEIEPKDLSKNLPYIDPVRVAAGGIDEFRRVFRGLTDANIRKIILHFNIASKDAIPAKGGPKGEELFDILWRGANNRLNRLNS